MAKFKLSGTFKGKRRSAEVAADSEGEAVKKVTRKFAGFVVDKVLVIQPEKRVQAKLADPATDMIPIGESTFTESSVPLKKKRRFPVFLVVGVLVLGLGVYLVPFQSQPARSTGPPIDFESRGYRIGAPFQTEDGMTTFDADGFYIKHSIYEEISVAPSFYLDDYTVATIDSIVEGIEFCLLYTSPSPRDQRGSRMPSSA